MGYRAYISYSHADERFAAWLQRQIETYRLPTQIAAEKGIGHLKPVFRDRADLPSSDNLSDAIQEAISRSEALIVICSDKAAASRWVGDEIELFRKTHGDGRIFAIIADDAPPGCFPAALLRDKERQPVEPIAADARRGFDGRRDALLKVIAGLLNVPFDGLKKRDLRRQVRRRTIATATAAAVAAVTLYLAVVAQDARETAERRRSQAEGLIAFMLGDLRSRLEPIGRLDVLDAVGDQAMDYFGSLEKDELTPEAQLGSARALRQIGEVRLSQGDLDRAFDAFSLSKAQARRLLDSDADAEPVEIELGQSHFWVGYVHLERGEVEMARSHFQQQLALSESLLRREPESADYQTEVAYALINLGTLEIAENRFDDADRYFRAAADINETLLENTPGDPKRLDDLATSWSWLGATASESGDIRSAVEWYAREYALRARAVDDPADWLETELLANTAILLGHHQLLSGDTDSAHQRFVEAYALGQRLVDHDPANALWQRLRGFASVALARSHMIRSELDAAREHADLAVADLLPLAEAAPDNIWASADLLKALAQQARVLRAKGDDAMALAIVTRTLNRYRDENAEDKRLLVEAARMHLLDGDFQSSAGRSDNARAAWTRARALLDKLPENRREAGLTLTRMVLAERLGESAAAERLWQQLVLSGYGDAKNGKIEQALIAGVVTDNE